MGPNTEAMIQNSTAPSTVVSTGMIISCRRATDSATSRV